MSVLTIWTRWNRPLLVLSGAMGVLTVVALFGIFLDDRIVTGAPVWMKVFKFAVSFLLYGLTLAWTLSVLPTRGKAAARAAIVIVAAAFIEVAIITGQAIRGTTSHFNETTLLDTVLWRIMSGTIVALWLAQLVITVVATRRPVPDRTAARGIQLGLAVSLLGMLVAFTMTMPFQHPSEVITGAHSVGVPDGGPGLPIVGWSTTGGDLRIAHFVGLHGLQALPLLGWWLTRLAGRGLPFDERTRVRLLTVAGAAYAALVLGLTWQALRGQPLISPDGLTLGALAALVVVTGIAAGLVIRQGRRAALPVREAAAIG
jgi:hypothetical protein